MYKRWPVQDAKSRFSELLDTALAEGPQIVTRRGVEAAVLLPIEQWRRLEQMTRPNLKELLLISEARTDDLAPPRQRHHRRLPKAVE
ncbi:MAG: type II toxin-antitoxin system Phd/YefM family antitoxin [Caldilineaceae bacterium SB0665_bin_21]|nr:type II toxin-antitoxin system Phd/YefM family antitoxin [Caldilineaceae bacterium SB0665_bin_21]